MSRLWFVWLVFLSLKETQIRARDKCFGFSHFLARLVKKEASLKERTTTSSATSTNASIFCFTSLVNLLPCCFMEQHCIIMAHQKADQKRKFIDRYFHSTWRGTMRRQNRFLRCEFLAKNVNEFLFFHSFLSFGVKWQVELCSRCKQNLLPKSDWRQTLNCLRPSQVKSGRSVSQSVLFGYRTFVDRVSIKAKKIWRQKSYACSCCCCLTKSINAKTKF